MASYVIILVIVGYLSLLFAIGIWQIAGQNLNGYIIHGFMPCLLPCIVVHGLIMAV